MKTIFASCIISACMLSQPVLPVAEAADCAAVASREANRLGAEVLKAYAEPDGNGAVCVIKLRIPGADGQRPRVEQLRVRS